jgi:putative ABC transport system ATP-binding protein
MTPIVEMDAVTRIYGAGATEVRAVDDVTLAVEPGEMVAVMGPSGCGKSTLLALVGGLEDASTGAVRVGGADLGPMRARDRAAVRRRTVGYVFQDLNLLGELTAAENVALPLELDGTSTAAARRVALAAMERLAVADLADRYPDELSGGQQQRVAICRAIAGDRRVILADEPTGALDSARGEEVVALLRTLAHEGAAVLLVTHNAQHAAVADRVLFMRDGAVHQETSARQVSLPTFAAEAAS